jgi:hypothetical protein
VDEGHRPHPVRRADTSHDTAGRPAWRWRASLRTAGARGSDDSRSARASLGSR